MKKNIILTVIFISFLALIYIAFEMLVPLHSGNKFVEIEIPKGTTFRQTVEILYNKKLIRDKNVLLLIGRLTNAEKKIKAGYYLIQNSMSTLEIFKKIVKGQIIEYEIKILEGDSLLEIAEKLSESDIIKKEDFFKLSKDHDFLAAYNIYAPSIEGYIFPDTYLIPKGIRPEDAIGLMINRMREKYSDKLLSRTAELGISENEVLTLASIIEKEAVLNSERPLISGVYHNRLKKKMYLQADPTVLYGIKSSKEKITKSDLSRKTPYNTYAFKGLPPGPIASPGMESIVAALYPADVPYLYFVSKDDITHQFSTTAEEHLKAVKMYRQKKQVIRKNNTKEGSKDNGTS